MRRAPRRSDRSGASALLLLALASVACRGGAGREAAADRPGPLAYVTIQEPRGDLAEAPREFAWREVPGAVAYKVTISDADALWPLFVRTTPETSLLLDQEESRAITAGRIHEWEVEALGSDGAPVATGAVRFRVLPPGEGTEQPPAKTTS